MEESDQDGGWVETHHFNPDGAGGSGLEDKVCEMTLEGAKVDDDVAADMDDPRNLEDGDGNGGDDDDDEGAAIDMDEFEESGMLDQVDPVSRLCGKSMLELDLCHLTRSHSSA